MTQRIEVVRATGRALLGCLLVTVLAAGPALSQQGPPPNIPPNPPPGQAKPKPPYNHDRGGIPPRANPNPPGKNQQAPGQTKNLAEGVGGVGEISATSLDGVTSPTGAAAGVAHASENVAAALRQGVFSVRADVAVPAETQQELLAVLSASGANGSATLERSLSARNASGAAQANLLVISLEGLLVQPERLREAVLAYNAFIEASSNSFLSDPPAELLAVQAVLASLVEASLEAEQPASNEVDRRAP